MVWSLLLYCIKNNVKYHDTKGPSTPTRLFSKLRFSSQFDLLSTRDCSGGLLKQEQFFVTAVQGELFREVYL